MSEWKLPKNFGKAWSVAEDAKVLKMFNDGMTIGRIAFEQQRTHSSVRLRLEKLGQVEPS